MQSSFDRPPDHSGPRSRPSIRMASIVLVVVLILASISGIVYLSLSKTGLSVSITSDRTIVTTGENITFDSSSSVPSNEIMDRTWNFGDGKIDTTNSQQVVHAYLFPGKYIVLLTVRDTHGDSASNWGSLLSIEVGASSSNDTEGNSTAPIAMAAADPSVLPSSANGAAVSIDGSSSTAWSVVQSSGAWSVAQGPEYISNMTWIYGDGSPNVSVNVSKDLSSDPLNFSQNFANITQSVHEYYGSGKVFDLALIVKSVQPEAPMSEYMVTIVLLPTNEVSGPVNDPDTFIEATNFSPQTLDPARCNDQGGCGILQNVYETLLWYNGSSSSTLIPMLATEVPSVSNGGITDNGTTYVFHSPSERHFPGRERDVAHRCRLLHKKGIGHQ